MSFFDFWTEAIAIDLGTANTLIIHNDKVVVDSPSIVAIDKKSRNGNEQRRNLDRPRKTMKFLINGYFQWIAFNTETFQFSGSGGGKYITKDGKYIESIEYFSRDDSKVGLNLEFDYELINKEWNHKGFSSKGDPLHEIWVVRK